MEPVTDLDSSTTPAQPTTAAVTGGSLLPLPPFAPGIVGLGQLGRFLLDKPGTLLRLARDYGPIVRFKMGGMPSTLVAQPDALKYAYANPDLFNKDSNAFRQMSTWLGNGLATAPGGPSWRRHRMFAQPAFSPRNIEALFPAIDRAIDGQYAKWEPSGYLGGAPVDIYSEMRHLALRIVGEALLTVDLVGDDYAPLAKAFGTTSRVVGFRAMHSYRLLDKLLFRSNRSFKQALREQHRIVRELIARRRVGGSNLSDLLQRLLDVRDPEGNALTDQEALDGIKTLFAAGHLTTAASLAWTVYHLCKDREIYQRAVAEVDAHFESGPLTAGNLVRLPYVRRVIQESLRLYPPIWVVTRNVVADAELGGYRIPKGEQILLSPFVAQRHPSNWSEPERFDPERFRPESAPRPGDCRYIPFGAGPRVCIGFSFAMMAMTTAIAKLLRSFSLELHSSHVFGFDPGLSLRPRGGIPVLLTARRAG